MSRDSIINDIVNRTSYEDWDKYSKTFLSPNPASTTITGQDGKNLETFTLYNINSDVNDPMYGATCDASVVEAIAQEYKRKINYDPNNPERKIVLFLLHHRSGYNANSLGGSLENTYTSSSLYQSIVQQALPAVVGPEEGNYGYEEIQNNPSIYHVCEYNTLFGKQSSYGFAYSICTAACVFMGNTGDVQGYSGFFYEGGGSIPGITAGITWQDLKVYVYTMGGGPLTPSNWIIKVVQAQTSTVVDNPPASARPYLYTDSNGAKHIVLKTYIHLLKPGGAYARRAIDRTTMVGDKINVGELSQWYYKDYANAIAMNNSENFKTMWNSIYSGTYRTLGAPTNEDFSISWNSGSPGGVANGSAIHEGQPSWSGKEVG